MNQHNEQQLGVLFERVDNLVRTLHEYTVADRLRHEDTEKALKAHIEVTLPIINDFLKLRGEFDVTKAALWLMAGALLTLAAGLVVQLVKGG